MSYNVYKDYGRVVGIRETHLRNAMYGAPKFIRPWYRMLIWNEERKRYRDAKYRLPGDNPWPRLWEFLATVIAAVFFLSALAFAGWQIIDAMFP